MKVREILAQKFKKYPRHIVFIEKTTRNLLEK